MELERLYAHVQNYQPVYLDGKAGATVKQGDLVCQLPPDPGSNSGFSPRAASAFPYGTGIVLARTALSAVLERLAALPKLQPTKEDTPVGTRERNTLHSIVAALLHLANLDITRPAKTAQVIEAECDRIGRPVAARTIQAHLNAANLDRESDKK
jgi:hypothetical protein